MKNINRLRFKFAMERQKKKLVKERSKDNGFNQRIL